jgi:Na+:H+ antiporter, NhaA family
MWRIRKIIRKKFISPIREFIKDSRAVGITLLVCTAFSLIMSNSRWQVKYLSFWDWSLHLPAPLHGPHTLIHWINDLLMAVFFFLVGMEIKRELIIGELSSTRKAIMPAAAAIGGMIVPAALFALANKGSVYAHGWGIPMATDIAFSLGVASLLGNRVPVSLKIFLMALAIIDDLGAILVIALFYGGQVSWWYLLTGLWLWLVGLYLNKRVSTHWILQLILGLLIWYCIFNSGIHATIAGVLAAFMIPVKQLEDYEHSFHDPVNFICLPLFALANTAIVLPANLMDLFSHSLTWGILLGLLIGKPLGITLFTWLIQKWGLGEIPKGTHFGQIVGLGILGGIGFTMSIFITMLAFNDPHAQDIAKMAVLLASILAMILGGLVLRWSHLLTKHRPKPEESLSEDLA